MPIYTIIIEDTPVGPKITSASDHPMVEPLSFAQQYGRDAARAMVKVMAEMGTEVHSLQTPEGQKAWEDAMSEERGLES